MWYKCNSYVLVNAAVDSHFFASWLSGFFLSFHLLTTAKNSSLKHCQFLRLVASFYDSNIPGNRVEAENVSEAVPVCPADRTRRIVPRRLCVLCIPRAALCTRMTHACVCASVLKMSRRLACVGFVLAPDTFLNSFCSLVILFNSHHGQ